MTKEERKEYMRKWREAHPDYHKQYYLEHTDEAKECQKQYRLEHKDEKNDYNKQYYLEHKGELKEYAKQYNRTKEGRAKNLLRGYYYADRKKGFDISNNITSEWIVANIFSGQHCIYCGETDWTLLGTDRVDNEKPHTPENCVPCCEICNKQRGRRYTFEEFKDKMAER